MTSAKNGPIATKRRANISIELWGSNMTIGFDLGHDLDLEFSRSNIEFAISQSKMCDCHEMKSKHIDWTQGLKCDRRFDLGHDLDLWILKVKCDLDLWPHTWPWPWIFMVKFWSSCTSEWEGRLTLHKGGGSRSFMTMTMTIWWPRSCIDCFTMWMFHGGIILSVPLEEDLLGRGLWGSSIFTILCCILI